MSSQTDKWIDGNKFNMIRDLQQLISFRSVEAAPEEGKPFGKTVYDCLNTALAQAAALGLEGRSLDGYCGIIDVGDAFENLGILCHLDVVPEGDGWIYPPFVGELHNRRVYGRGAIDDKGPAIAALYALAAVKASGYGFRRKVRIILGCNEETGMKCIEHFLQKENAPTMTFTPDGFFPLSNSEKSIMTVNYRKNYNSNIEMNVGEAHNIVPGKAKAVAFGTEYYCEGVQAHASTPEAGKNAIQMMFCKLAEYCSEEARENAEKPISGEDARVIKGLVKNFGMEYDGKSIGIDKQDASGRQTLNFGMIRWNSKGFELTLDLRCPTSIAREFILDKLDAAFAEIGAERTACSYSQGYSLDDNCELVSKLMEVYRNRTGDVDAQPKKMGGGTYARHLPNAVSFGPEGWLCESDCHVANEFISIEQLLFNAKIIADAIIALACD